MPCEKHAGRSRTVTLIWRCEDFASGSKMKKNKLWNDYESGLLKRGAISEEEMMIEKMKMDFAKLIYACRTHRHLTQKQLAEKMNVQQQHIAKIESGEENLSLETIGKLLVALKSVLHVEVEQKRKLTGIFEVAAV